jgi:hypothetical protein
VFISSAHGGIYIASVSGFLEYLCPGDEVMADPGFAVHDLLQERKVN